MNDLSQIKSNIEAMGGQVEVQNFCGISWTDPENPGVVFTDGNTAVGEITAVTEFGPVVIPVCEQCLQLVSEGINNKFSIGDGE